MAWIVQSLNEEWASIADSPAARRALMRWATANPVLAQTRSIDDLVDTRACVPWGREAHRVLAAEAPTDHLAARTLLQAFLGGLVCLSRRIGHDDPDAIDELVSLGWTRIRTYPSQRRGAVAANVLLDVRKQYLQAMHGDAGGADACASFDRPDHTPTPEQIVCEHVVFDELMAAKDRGLVSVSALETIIRTRVGGETLIEVAADMGISPDAIWRRRTRAEERLRSLPLAS